MYGRKLQMMFCLEWADGRCGHVPQLRVGRILPRDKRSLKLYNTLEDHTVPAHQYIVNKLVLFSQEVLNI